MKYLQENESLLKQIEKLNEKSIGLSSEKQEIVLKYQNLLEKNQGYEDEIVMRTEKLK